MPLGREMTEALNEGISDACASSLQLAAFLLLSQRRKDFSLRGPKLERSLRKWRIIRIGDIDIHSNMLFLFLYRRSLSQVRRFSYHPHMYRDILKKFFLPPTLSLKILIDL